MAFFNFLESHYGHYKDRHYREITAQNMLLDVYIISRTVCIMLTVKRLERSGTGVRTQIAKP